MNTLIQQIEILKDIRIKQAKAIFGADFEPVILFLTDTDLYKLTMQQTILHRFPNTQNTEFHFKCRNENINLVQHIDEIRKQIAWACQLTYAQFELDFIASQRYVKADFVDFLSLFQLREKYIEVVAINEHEIDIIARGPWLHIIPFELIALPIVNEIYFRNTQSDDAYIEGNKRLDNKIQLVKELNKPEFKFTDFGTRRRYSRDWQEHVVTRLKAELPDNLSGTSNVFLAMKHNLTPIGTMAHEYLQAGQALGPRLIDSQKFALENWVQEYRGDLGIALTDVVGTDAFLRDFDLYFCKLFDGVRHDSGDPYVWTEKILNHYEKMKIDAKTKSLVYSDGLDFPKAIKLFNTYVNKAKLFFGIGTNITNDLGFKALNIVMKMTICNGSPVAKVSDDEGKEMSKDYVFVTYLKQVFNITSKK